MIPRFKIRTAQLPILALYSSCNSQRPSEGCGSKTDHYSFEHPERLRDIGLPSPGFPKSQSQTISLSTSAQKRPKMSWPTKSTSRSRQIALGVSCFQSGKVGGVMCKNNKLIRYRAEIRVNIQKLFTVSQDHS